MSDRITYDQRRRRSNLTTIVEMDPISIASGIAGLLSLGGEILYERYRYINEAGGYRKEMKLLLPEIGSLSALLTQLHIVVAGLPSDTTAQQIAKLSSTGDAVKECNDLLHMIDNLLSRSRSGGVNKLRQAISWLQKTKEISKVLEKLNKLHEIFTTAISLDTLSGMKRIETGVAKVLERQKDSKYEEVASQLIGSSLDSPPPENKYTAIQE
ncbi:hypothetical protein BDD12DRAFT_884581 [Trichophaea hybrida]|nr:hypothetical protein BDD12DRAFT_884581 [Trichophaea hybrida]